MRLDQEIKPTERVEGPVALDQASLPALSYVLRHKEHWPKDFKWAFHDCQRCAMGIAYQTWPETVKMPHSIEMERAFGMDSTAAKNIFSGWGYDYTEFLSDISPEMVADRIDAYLEGK